MQTRGHARPSPFLLFILPRVSGGQPHGGRQFFACKEGRGGEDKATQEESKPLTGAQQKIGSNRKKSPVSDGDSAGKKKRRKASRAPAEETHHGSFLSSEPIPGAATCYALGAISRGLTPCATGKAITHLLDQSCHRGEGGSWWPREQALAKGSSGSSVGTWQP